MDEKSRAKHETVVRFSESLIIGKIHRKAAHQGVVLCRGLPRQGVNVGQQLIAQARRIEKGGVYIGGRILEYIRLTLDVSSVDTIDGIEDGELIPTGEEFPVFRVLLPSFVVHEKSSGVLSPIGQTRHGDVDATRDLVTKCLPARRGVPRPGHRGIALLSGPG